MQFDEHFLLLLSIFILDELKRLIIMRETKDQTIARLKREVAELKEELKS